MAFTYGQYNGKKLDDLSGAERRAYEASVNAYQASQRRQPTPIVNQPTPIVNQPTPATPLSTNVSTRPAGYSPTVEGIYGGQNPNLDKLGNPLPDPKYRTPPGLIAPDPMTAVTWGLVDFVNPSTGQKFTAGSGGYTPAPGSGWVRGNESSFPDIDFKAYDPFARQAAQEEAVKMGEHLRSIQPNNPSTPTFGEQGYAISNPEPDYNYTYEQALGRQGQRDVKSPKEQAAINAALQGNTPRVDAQGNPIQGGVSPFNFFENIGIGDFMGRQFRPDLYESRPSPAPSPVTNVQGTQQQASQMSNLKQLKLDRINQELADLYAQNPPDAAAIEAKTQERQKAGAEAMTEGQQNLVSTAVKSPEQLATKTAVAQIDPNTVGTTIAQGTGDAGTAGQATATQTGAAQQATTPTGITPASVQATTTQGAVDTALGSVDAAQGTVSTTVDAATKDPTTVAGTDLDVDRIAEATQVVKPDPRLVQTGELLDGSAVNMAAVQAATDIQAATADPTKQATVKGQLDDLMDDFDGGATPAWAAGAMRAATAAMAARGLGSSSMAGQAIVQAAMESALPIAQQDAQTVAAFEAANLSNRQQTALFAAQQRADFLKLDFNQEFQSRVENAAKISDIANMNFTAEQQIALENARMAQTVDLTNLNARNAKIMANAAAMANMDMANLSNQQQARVENAKSFLQIDMANLSNAQQVEIFKANSVQQAILSDAAADNAAKQFNASSVNQTNQFMADLESRTSQFNAAQSNALEQFNVGEVNAIAQFNEEQNNAREEFNTKNALIIAQANAQWRQSTTTTNTAAQNEANMQDAKAMNAFTASTLDQVWQRERDLLSYAWQANESALKRINDVIIQNILATSAANTTAATNAANVQAAAVSAEGSKWGQIGAAIIGINWG